MRFSELKRLVDLYDHEKRDDAEVVVQIKLPYATVGARPTVKIKNAQMGFDWDAGKFIFCPEEELTPSDRDFAEQMKQMQDRAGWADYENRNLKAEIRRLKKKIKEGAGGNYTDIVSDGGMDPRS
jgi:hypothetical protein